MRTINLGILAHVDAGKTSLTERLLHTCGVISEIGSVDDGSTQTDSLALERARGITIKSAVVSFAIGDVTANLIDTPGHPDFIAEVERVLSVLDGAVLVISAVEGVQAQTRVLMRTLRRLRIPTLLFVNKIDRRGAQYEGSLRAIAEKLAPTAIPMGSVDGLGSRGATFEPFGASDEEFASSLVNVLAEQDDRLLAAYVDGGTAIPYERLRYELASQTHRALVHPVLFGSAITGAGVDALIAAIRELLPAVEGEEDAPVSGTVFKVERGPSGEKIAYVRMFSGCIQIRDRLRFGRGREGKVSAVSVFADGSADRRRSVAANQIGKLWGLADIRIGDTIGESATSIPGRLHFAPPTLETVIVPLRAADRGRLQAALSELAEQDPLINLRQDDTRQELFFSLYGEVQKEVIQATLADEYGIDVSFRETTTVCVERPVGTGAAVEFIGKHPNPFLATVGLRVDPGPVGSGVTFGLGVELGSMPPSLFNAVEEAVHETLQQGLCGWAVLDCEVTMTHSGYWARQSHAHGTFDKSMSSTAGDFRNLTPLVLVEALRLAGTSVYEPIHGFSLDLPADTVGPVLRVLARLQAVVRTSGMHGSEGTLEGEIPAAQVNTLQKELPALTRGEGVLESAFEAYRQVQGVVPRRQRTDHNPLDRVEYLLHVQRRV
ncbi:translation factor GTPase family protein [Streptomyces sp. NPDC094034]|uniref:translation factor GTPase family protein n=1 Tax=Streptomyces sp. NPDC094034 TaxID=3155309 RepID=UPI00332F9048